MTLTCLKIKEMVSLIVNCKDHYTDELQQKLERVQNYGMRLILSQPPRTPRDGLRKVMKWMPLKKRREMFRLVLVQRCVTKQAPQCLREVFRTNGEVGYRGCNKLFLPSVRTEYYRRSFTFKGAQGWNGLPDDMRGVSSDVFKRRLRAGLLLEE